MEVDLQEEHILELSLVFSYRVEKAHSTASFVWNPQFTGDFFNGVRQIFSKSSGNIDVELPGRHRTVIEVDPIGLFTIS